jgi:nucleotide-binding universal stress UspA family protein
MPWGGSFQESRFFMYQHILMPTDGSSASEDAIKHGLALAKLSNAKVTFLFALENPFITTWAEVGFEDPASIDRISKDLRVLGSRALESAEKLAQAEGVQSERLLVENARPAEAILTAAKTHDLIVIGTHGRGGLERMLLGSVAERVVRGARTPVLVIHPEPKRT